MNLNVSGHHVTVTESMRDYVMSKLGRITRHFDHVIDVNVILSVEKLRRKAEATVHVRGKDIHVASDDADLYAAVDTMVDKLDRSILKYKEGIKDHHHDALKRRPEPESEA